MYVNKKGLYHGIIPATMGAVFAHGIRTGVYEFVQSGLGQLQDKGLVPISDVQIQVRQNPTLLCGCIAACVLLHAVGRRGRG
jgi:hypothetical protein